MNSDLERQQLIKALEKMIALYDRVLRAESQEQHDIVGFARRVLKRAEKVSKAKSNA